MALLWGQDCPEAINNSVPIKLLVSVFSLDIYIMYTCFTSWQVLYLHLIGSVLVICHLTYNWQRRVSCMRQGTFNLSGAPSTTSHLNNLNLSNLDHYILPILSLFGKSYWRGEWRCLGNGAQWDTAIVSYLQCHEYTVTSSEGSLVYPRASMLILRLYSSLPQNCE